MGSERDDDPDLSTATAHHHWDREWRSDDGRAAWLVPDPDVVEVLGLLGERGARRALDVGCGPGRHALLLAGHGLETHAVDLAAAGLDHLRDEARLRGLDVAARTAAMTDLPYADASFDYVLAFNVLYHGEPAVVRRAIAEIRRVLRPGGIYQGTMLSKRNDKFGIGREVAPDTWVLDGESDKAHPHFYCDARGLLDLHPHLEPLRLSDREHAEPGSWHWHLTAERLPG